MADALAGLVVDPGRMRENLAATRGLAMAEAVTMALATSLGKSDAHARVEKACRRAIAEGRDLIEILSEDPVVTAVLDRAALQRHLTPDRYLGAARAFVDRILAVRDGEMRRG
jgi:3-carboxy-cis,cis-muconate cycloisomerase